MNTGCSGDEIRNFGIALIHRRACVRRQRASHVPHEVPWYFIDRDIHGRLENKHGPNVSGKTLKSTGPFILTRRLYELIDRTQPNGSRISRIYHAVGTQKRLLLGATFEHWRSQYSESHSPRHFGVQSTVSSYNAASYNNRNATFLSTSKVLRYIHHPWKSLQ